MKKQAGQHGAPPRRAHICPLACLYAVNLKCRCGCLGKNHGIGYWRQLRLFADPVAKV